MAGKAKPTNRQKPETVSARVTIEEKRWVQQQAASVAMKPSEFARHRILGEQLRHTDKTYALVRALSASGTSLNQIARAASRAGQVEVLEAVMPLVADITDIIRRLKPERR